MANQFASKIDARIFAEAALKHRPELLALLKAGNYSALKAAKATTKKGKVWAVNSDKNLVAALDALAA